MGYKQTYDCFILGWQIHIVYVCPKNELVFNVNDVGLRMNCQLLLKQCLSMYMYDIKRKMSTCIWIIACKKKKCCKWNYVIVTHVLEENDVAKNNVADKWCC